MYVYNIDQLQYLFLHHENSTHVFHMPCNTQKKNSFQHYYVNSFSHLIVSFSQSADYHQNLNVWGHRNAVKTLMCGILHAHNQVTNSNDVLLIVTLESTITTCNIGNHYQFLFL